MSNISKEHNMQALMYVQGHPEGALLLFYQLLVYANTWYLVVFM